MVKLSRPHLLTIAVIAGLLSLDPITYAQLAPPTINAQTFRARIERALTIAPREYRQLLPPAQAGVQVRSVQIERTSAESQRVTIDLSQKALTYDP